MENKQKNPRKRLNSLILLVAFTAIMLIVSTYAWFSAQRNVTLSNLEGTVNVAEGLEISLDALNWSQEVNFENEKYAGENLKALYSETAHNVVPDELIPLSADGKEAIGEEELTLYNGVNTINTEDDLYNPGSSVLGGIVAANEGETDPASTEYPGFYAIDVFLRNSSRLASGVTLSDGTSAEFDSAAEAEDTNGDSDGITSDNFYDILQLNANSGLQLKSGGSDTTGLQNTVRVAFAQYAHTARVDAGVTADAAGQTSILDATTTSSSLIKDVAIWEPNSDAHVPYIVENNNILKLSTDDDAAYIAASYTSSDAPVASAAGKPKFADAEKLPTYALLAASVGQELDDIYDWAGTYSTYLGKQITLQTTRERDEDNYNEEIAGQYQIAEGVQNLVSVNSTEASVYPNAAEEQKAGLEFIKMPKNSIIRLRMYVWLEGQDPDCVNYASHGAGIHLDVGLVKGAAVGGNGEAADDTPAATPTGS